MPLYEIQCDACLARSQIWRKVAQRDEIPFCDACGTSIPKRVISAPYISPDITPYVSPGSGKVISSRAQMEYDLKSTGHIINEPGLRKDIERRKTEVATESFKPIADGIDSTVRNLVNAGQLNA